MRDHRAHIAIVVALVLGDEAVNPQPSAALAAAVGDLEHAYAARSMSPKVITVCMWLIID